MENNNNNINMINNSILKTKRTVKNKVELEQIIKRYEEIIKKRKLIQSNDEKIFYDITYKDEENELFNLIQNGITIESIPYKNTIIDNLYYFFKEYGITKEEIISRISELNYFVSDINIGYGGKLVEVCNRIGIDISYGQFSETGEFEGFRNDTEDFLIHCLTHEFLHKLSSSENDNPVLCLGDPIIEGYTDMFAHLVSGKKMIRSDLYDFPEKLCILFTKMIGLEKTVNDYIYNNQTHPNLRNLFLECGCQDFQYFYTLLSTTTKKIIAEKKEGKTTDFALDEKTECLTFISENILIPYCTTHTDEAEYIFEQFNALFGEYGYNYNVENTIANNKNI